MQWDLTKIAEVADGIRAFPHQGEAIARFLENDNVLVAAHEVGLGKSVFGSMAFETARRLGRLNRALVVVPAGLRQNFVDNLTKTTKGSTYQVLVGKADVDPEEHRVHFAGLGPTDYTIVSYSMFRKDPEAVVRKTGADLLIMDEMHRARSRRSETFAAAMKIRPKMKGFIGLTGSIFNNDPDELVPLMRIATNDEIPIRSEHQFNTFFKEVAGEQQGFFGGTKQTHRPRRLSQMAQAFGKYLDLRETSDLPDAPMPKKQVEVIPVEMSDLQKQLYQFSLQRLPWATRFKIAHNIPMDKRESSSVFAMLLASRQVSNSVHTLHTGIGPEQAAFHTPKIRTMLEDVTQHLRRTPDGQVVVFSNMVVGGIDVAAAGLKRLGVPFGTFIGKGREVAGERSTEESRTEDVEAYNRGELKVLLISGAGAEGLNLPNTTFAATLDGHFNPERILQGEARGRRLGGQSHRPLAKRRLIVRRYVSVVPPSWLDKIFGRRETSVDEYVYSVAAQKHRMNKAFKDAFMRPEDDDKLLALAESFGVAVQDYAPDASEAPDITKAPDTPKTPPAAAIAPGEDPDAATGSGKLVAKSHLQQVKPAKHRKYLRRWRDPETGEWRYAYADDSPSAAGPAHSNVSLDVNPGAYKV